MSWQMQLTMFFCYRITVKRLDFIKIHLSLYINLCECIQFLSLMCFYEFNNYVGYFWVLVLFLTEQTDRLPIEGDAELLARTLLLSVTLDWRRSEKQRPGDMGLEELFGPLLDILQRLNTSVYLSVCKIDKCLQLMLRLLVLLGRYVERSRVKGLFYCADK